MHLGADKGATSPMLASSTDFCARAGLALLFLIGVAVLSASLANAQAVDAEKPAGASESQQPGAAPADAGAAPSETNAAATPPDEAAAQSDADLEQAPGAPVAPPEGVEEITVIGEVLETSTQAEAEAITTFDQAELDTLGIADVDSLALNTPSLHVGQVGQQAVVTLRGIGVENLTSIGETGVGFQVDGVHLGRPSAANAGFYDLERVDVLRGPTGTAGGRNLNGGKIALWSAKPTEEFEAKGDATYGNYDTMESRAVVNVPIWSDKLMSRVSALFSRRRGYQDNDFYAVDNKDAGDAKDFSGRAQLRSLLFDQQVELRAIGTHAYQRGRGPDLKLLGAPPSTLPSTIGQYSINYFFFHGSTAAFSDQFVPDDCPPQTQEFVPPQVCTLSDPRDAYQEFVPHRSNEASGLTGIATWDVPLFQDTPVSDLRLGLIGSWQQGREDFLYDFDGTNIPEQLLDNKRNAKQKSLEVFIERPDVGRWDFRAGAFLFDEEIDVDVCFDNAGVATFPGDFAYDGDIETKSIAGYGEAGFRILDNLRAYGGVRWSEDEKTANEQFFQVSELNRFPFNRTLWPVTGINDPLNQPDACGSYTRSLVTQGQRLVPIDADLTTAAVDPDRTTKEYPGTTPMGGFEWQVTDVSTLGLSVTRGFKAGGFPTVVNPNVTSFSQPYDSEFTWEFELTAKNELFDGRMRLNANLFWVEYDPFQVCQFDGPAFVCNSNGSATIRGIELEWLATPIEGLQINGFFNWLDARINNFEIIDPTERVCLQIDCSSGPQAGQPRPFDVSGNTLSKSPPWAGAFGIQYELDFGRWGFFTPRFQTQFQDKTFYRVFNSYEGVEPEDGVYRLEDDFTDAFIKYDAKIMWRSEDDRFYAEIFGANLSDEDVINSVFVGSQFSGGQAFAQYQPPRTYGVKIGINSISDWVSDWLP